MPTITKLDQLLIIKNEIVTQAHNRSKWQRQDLVIDEITPEQFEDACADFIARNRKYGIKSIRDIEKSPWKRSLFNALLIDPIIGGYLERSNYELQTEKLQQAEVVYPHYTPSELEFFDVARKLQVNIPYRNNGEDNGIYKELPPYKLFDKQGMDNFRQRELDAFRENLSDDDISQENEQDRFEWIDISEMKATDMAYTLTTGIDYNQIKANQRGFHYILGKTETNGHIFTTLSIINKNGEKVSLSMLINSWDHYHDYATEVTKGRKFVDGKGIQKFEYTTGKELLDASLSIQVNEDKNCAFYTESFVKALKDILSSDDELCKKLENVTSSNWPDIRTEVQEKLKNKLEQYFYKGKPLSRERLDRYHRRKRWMDGQKKITKIRENVKQELENHTSNPSYALLNQSIIFLPERMEDDFHPKHIFQSTMEINEDSILTELIKNFKFIHIYEKCVEVSAFLEQIGFSNLSIQSSSLEPDYDNKRIGVFFKSEEEEGMFVKKLLAYGIQPESYTSQSDKKLGIHLAQNDFIKLLININDEYDCSNLYKSQIASLVNTISFGFPSLSDIDFSLATDPSTEMIGVYFDISDHQNIFENMLMQHGYAVDSYGMEAIYLKKENLKKFLKEINTQDGLSLVSSEQIESLVDNMVNKDIESLAPTVMRT